MAAPDFMSLGFLPTTHKLYLFPTDLQSWNYSQSSGIGQATWNAGGWADIQFAPSGTLAKIVSPTFDPEVAAVANDTLHLRFRAKATVGLNIGCWVTGAYAFTFGGNQAVTTAWQWFEVSVPMTAPAATGWQVQFTLQSGYNGVISIDDVHVWSTKDTAPSAQTAPVADYGNTAPTAQAAPVADYGNSSPSSQDAPVTDYGNTAPDQAWDHRFQFAANVENWAATAGNTATWNAGGWLTCDFNPVGVYWGTINDKFVSGRPIIARFKARSGVAGRSISCAVGQGTSPFTEVQLLDPATGSPVIAISDSAWTDVCVIGTCGSVAEAPKFIVKLRDGSGQVIGVLDLDDVRIGVPGVNDLEQINGSPSAQSAPVADYGNTAPTAQAAPVADYSNTSPTAQVL